MKKLIAGASAAGLMSASLVAFTGGTAQAVCDDYAGQCAPTDMRLRVQKRLEPREAPNFKINIVSATEENETPRGRLIIRTKRMRKGMDVSINRWYGGGIRSYKAPRVAKPGNYRLILTFIPRNDNLRVDRKVRRLRVRR